MTEEYTGGSVSYYAIKVERPTNPDSNPYTAECNDIIEALGMNYAEGNAFKAIWRRCAARLGKSKKGYTDGLYDAEKVVFFGQRLVAQEKAGCAENGAAMIGVAGSGNTSNPPKRDVTIMTDWKEETPTHASMVIDGIAYTITQALAEKIERMAEAETEKVGGNALSGVSNIARPAHPRPDVTGSILDPMTVNPDDEGWIDWSGGECPVGDDVCVDCVLRNWETRTFPAGNFRWCHDGNPAHWAEFDIIKYRIQKEQ